MKATWQENLAKYNAKKELVLAAMKAGEDDLIRILESIERDPELSEREKENLITKVDAIACDRLGHCVQWDWN